MYALGATLYELLTRPPAVDGDEHGACSAGSSTATRSRRGGSTRRVPADLETVVLRLLAKDPADRYPTAGELADDLRRFLADKPIRARRPPPVRAALPLGRRHRRAAAAAVTGWCWPSSPSRR